MVGVRAFLVQGHTHSKLVTEPEKTEPKISGSQSRAISTLMWLGYKKARQGKNNSKNICQKVTTNYIEKRGVLKKKMMGEMLKHFENKCQGMRCRLKCSKKLVQNQTGKTLSAYWTDRNIPKAINTLSLSLFLKHALLSLFSHFIWDTGTVKMSVIILQQEKNNGTGTMVNIK